MLGPEGTLSGKFRGSDNSVLDLKVETIKHPFRAGVPQRSIPQLSPLLPMILFLPSSDTDLKTVIQKLGKPSY